MEKSLKQTIILSLLALTLGCQPAQQSSSTVLDAETELEFADKLEFDSYFDFTEAKGQTYLAFMKESVKPEMDRLATDGYTLRGSDAITIAYGASDGKVKGKVNKWGLDRVKKIADALAGKNATLNTLPKMIKSVDSNIDSYGLSTFLGMASGGGVKIRYFSSNYGLNVHYDTTEQRSGRSFGVGPTRGANDASDKNYLDDLQTYVTDASDNTNEFYKTLFQSLLNSDASNYPNIAEEGQTVLTDFLSVFTAEQARNLMDGSVSPHWDAALLEVTLLASFHGGQNELKLYYKNPETQEVSFTNATLRQTPCEIPTQKTKAKLRDYWQFSRNISSPSNCSRSGINITKNEFRKLGSDITAYLYTNHRDLFDRLKSSLGLTGSEKNLFKALSYFLISQNSPDTISESDTEDFANTWVEMLSLVKTEANEISTFIEQN